MASAAGDPSVSIGRVFTHAFGTIGGNPVTTLGIAFLFGGLPSILLAYAVQKYGGQTIDLMGDWIFLLATKGATIAVAMITLGALVRATTAHGEGRTASFSESAAPGVALALPLFVLAVLSGAGIGIGLLFLFVPGMLLFVIWSVAAPALVEERLGPLQALGRSRSLTKGARWKVLAVLLVATIGSWLASGVLGLINTGLFGGPEDLMTPLGTDPRLPFVFYSVNALFQTLNLAVWAVIQTSLYSELREWQEGPQTDRLAEIFA